MTEATINNTIVFNKSQTKPVGPRPREPLASYLERSSGNITVPQESSDTITMSYSRQGKHSNNINYENSEEDESDTNEQSESTDDSLLFKSFPNDSQTPVNKSVNNSKNDFLLHSYDYKSKTCETKIIRRQTSVPKSSKNGTNRRSETAYESHSMWKENTHTESSNKNFVCLVLLLVLLGISGIVFLLSNSDIENSANISKDSNKERLLRDLEKSIKRLSKEFPRQDPNIWYEIIPSIKNVVENGNKPSMIILFAKESHVMNCIARAVATASITALQTSSFLTLTPENMGDNLGNILIALKPEIEKKNVVIVQDLLNIHPQAIRAFHNLCDRENPFVRKALYIFTILANVDDKIEKPLELIEDEISRKFSFIDEDILLPLITRLTEGPALQIQAEADQHKCLYH